jgi:hypothetical protein
VLTAVLMKIEVSWDVTACLLVNVTDVLEEPSASIFRDGQSNFAALVTGHR